MKVYAKINAFTFKVPLTTHSLLFISSSIRTIQNAGAVIICCIPIINFPLYIETYSLHIYEYRDRVAWHTAIHGVTKNQTRLND